MVEPAEVIYPVVTLNNLNQENVGRVHPVFRQETFKTGIKLRRDNPTTVELEQAIIQAGGKIPFSKFMGISLYGKDGYYSCGKAAIGEGAHFITSPERSELFGAIIGRSAMKVWEAMGRPEKFQIVEMGAGQGSLAEGLLKWMKSLYPEFYQAIQYTIVEYGSGMIDKQKWKLQMYPAFSNKVNFVQGSAYEIPLAGVRGMFISNELPDAFPVERVTLIKGQLKQKYVTIQNDKWIEEWDESTKEVAEFINKYKIDIKEGIEEPINLLAEKFQDGLDQALEQGVILTIDYGENKEVGEKNQLATRCYGVDSYWAGEKKKIKRHLYPLYESPGRVDITASVNFKVLEEKAKCDGLTIGFSGYQKDFLAQTGIRELEERINNVAKKIKTWGYLVPIIENFGKYNYVVSPYHLGDNYSQMLLKGIDPGQIAWEKTASDYEPQLFKVPIKLGNARKKVVVDFSNSDLLEWKKPEILECDDDGNLWLSVGYLDGARIYKYHDRFQGVFNFFEVKGAPILDLTKKSNLNRLISNLGYSLSPYG